MSDADYFAVDAMSASMLKAGAVSMLYMQHRMETPMTPSAGMIKGTLGHMAVLEPLRFMALPVCDLGKRTKGYKEFVANAGDEIVISSTDKKSYSKQRLQVMNHPEVRKLGLFTEGEPEAEIYWDEDGKPCKCKVDWLGPDYWVEYKTTAKLGGLESTFAKMFYHIQLGWYDRGVSTLGKKRRRIIIAQEQNEPYDVAVMTVPKRQCKQWFEQAMDIYEQWLSGDRGGAFPVAFQFELPPWMQEENLMDVEEQMDEMFGKAAV